MSFHLKKFSQGSSGFTIWPIALTFFALKIAERESKFLIGCTLWHAFAIWYGVRYRNRVFKNLRIKFGVVNSWPVCTKYNKVATWKWECPISAPVTNPSLIFVNVFFYADVIFGVRNPFLNHFSVSRLLSRSNVILKVIFSKKMALNLELSQIERWHLARNLYFPPQGIHFSANWRSHCKLKSEIQYGGKNGCCLAKNDHQFRIELLHANHKPQTF